MARTLVLTGIALLQLAFLSSRSHAAPGDVDLSFDPGAGVNGPVNAVVVQPDGKVIIGGQFTAVRGLLRTNLARLNADGSGDPTFNPSLAHRLVTSMALQPDGRVLVGGQFLNIVCDESDCYEFYDFLVTRLDADGSVDSSFTPAVGMGDPYEVSSVAVQSDGKVLVGGSFSAMNGTNRSGIARLHANGTLDTSFNPGTGIGGHQAGVNDVTVQSDGKVLIGGNFTTFDGTNRHGVARLNANGSLDLTFDPGLVIGAQYPRVESVAVQPDGNILLGGYFTNVNGDGIIRVHPNGTLDNSFNSGAGAFGVVTAVAIHLDGKVIVGGYFISINGTNRGNGIARLNVDGGLDLSFDSGTGAAGVAAMAQQANGQVFIAGNFTAVNTSNCTSIARLNPDGSLDGSFYPGRKVDAVSSLVALPDGKVLIGGVLTFVNGTNSYGSARLNGDGSVDGTFFSSSFNPDLAGLIPNEDCPPGFPDPCVTVIVPERAAVQSDGKVLVGGYGLTTESYFDGDIYYYRYFIARLHSDGSRDASFEPAVGDRVYWDKQTVRAIAVQPDGKVVIGGIFGSIHGTNRAGIARLNANGSLDTGFAPGIPTLNGGVDSVALQSDGKVLVGGYFNFGIARLNSDGSLDGSFNASMGAYGVSSVALQSDGKVLIGGGFTSVNGTNRNRIARLNANGSLDLSFNPGTGANGAVRCIALQPNGNVIIGGDFTTINGVVRPRLARLYGDSFAPSLSIARSNASVIVSWPLNALNFQLQETTNLALPNSWSPVGQPAVTNAGQLSVSLPTASGRRFFLLKSP